jgi:hypothetical protein
MIDVVVLEVWMPKAESISSRVLPLTRPLFNSPGVAVGITISAFAPVRVGFEMVLTTRLDPPDVEEAVIPDAGITVVIGALGDVVGSVLSANL